MSPIVIPGGTSPGGAGASTFQIGRLLVGPPPQWHEAIGDPVTNLGGAPIPAPRQALRHAIDIATYAGDGYPDTVSDRLRLRRQLRSMFNNTPLKMQLFYYVQYSDDPEQNGWYVPDFGQLQDIDGAVGLATGVWKLAQVAWLVAGKPRVNREARNIWMKELRAGQFPRDTLRLAFGADFAWMPSLQLTAFPHGATQLTQTVNGQVLVGTRLPTGRDTGSCPQAQGLTDLTCVSFDRTEANINLSDVIAYDRRGQITAPATGPDTNWEEAYGPDYPWSWLTAGQPSDTPVFDNGLTRVRYDTTGGTPGWCVDVWTTNAYVEQGKMIVVHNGDISGVDNVWVAASLAEYTPDRAVMQVVLRASTDTRSRERVFITLNRGQIGANFEVYPSLKAAGTQSDCQLQWTLPVVDSATSYVKVDAPASITTTVAAGSNGVNVSSFIGGSTLNVASTTGFAASGTLAVQTGSGTALVAYAGGGGGGTTFTGCNLAAGGVTSGTLATGNPVSPALPGAWLPGAAAGTQNAGPAPGRIVSTVNSGSSLFSTSFASLGDASHFGSENWVSVMRYSDINTIMPWQTNLVVLSANPNPEYAASPSAYGPNQNAFTFLTVGGPGYLQVQLSFTATQPLQVMAAHNMTLGAGTTAVVNANAADGTTTQSTRTADAVHVSQTVWPVVAGKWRVFARVKTSASTLNIYAKTTGSTGATVQTTSTTYIWVDLGDIVGNNSTLEIHAWATAAATIQVDRIEAVWTEDRTKSGFIYSGARDQGQSALFDSRTMGAIVAR